MMTRLKLAGAMALALSLPAAPALAHDCLAQVEQLDTLLQEASEKAISASSGGQAVAGAREAQALTDTGAADDDGDEGDRDRDEEPAVPLQDDAEEAAAVAETEAAGDGGEQFIQARALLETAREAFETGDEASCAQGVDEVLRLLIAE